MRLLARKAMRFFLLLSPGKADPFVPGDHKLDFSVANNSMYTGLF